MLQITQLWRSSPCIIALLVTDNKKPNNTLSKRVFTSFGT